MAAFDVLTIHPEVVRGGLLGSVVGRAVRAGTIAIGVHDVRDVTADRHRTVDDTPYGGGAGMVMKVDVVAAALARVRRPGSVVLLTSPAGRTFTQADARRYAAAEHVVVVCGHYEGIDARVEALVDELVSIGDFVLTGGELAACVIVDASARLLPGVLGNAESAVVESFDDDLLEYPQFTRPLSWEGREVPAVLRSGDHGRVAAWRLGEARARTKALRPDLWLRHCERHGLSPDSDPREASPRRRRARGRASGPMDVDGGEPSR
jgi:tRNA (guanine37-N1)-methyltransferase